MRCILYKQLALLSILQHVNVSAVSIVYNFRIAQITKQPIFERTEDKRNTLVVLPFYQFRQKYNGTRQNFLGSLGSYIYHSKQYYFRTDFALSHIKDHSKDTLFSDTETDDILFTLGRNVVLSKKDDITLSGLFGIPTHRVFRLQHLEFGTGQYGVGLQLDGFHGLDKGSAFLYGARYIHFLPRNALDTTEKKYRFTRGNIGDLFFAYKYNWNNHGIETGYTARTGFGAHISPHLDDIVKKSTYTRSNFYAVYKYKFLINNLPNRFLFNISYGFDHNRKEFSNKYIVTFWASWNINF